MCSGWWIYLLEAGVALAILVFIVWWTLPNASRGEGGDAARSDRNDDPPR